MTSGPIYALVLSRDDAIKQWRALMGPTNCFKAREEAPKRCAPVFDCMPASLSYPCNVCSLRALYGTDGTQNATHGSDSPASAAREIKFFFPALVLEPSMEANTAKGFITEKLQPALAQALTALAREKPSAEKFEVRVGLPTNTEQIRGFGGTPRLSSQARISATCSSSSTSFLRPSHLSLPTCSKTTPTSRAWSLPTSGTPRWRRRTTRPSLHTRR